MDRVVNLQPKMAWHNFIVTKVDFFVCFHKYFSRTLASYLLVRERSLQSTVMYFRVTSLEQLSLAEFTGGKARPNDHKNVLGTIHKGGLLKGVGRWVH